ncbi:3-hydroxybutyrate dehydrogenase [Janibacter sp. Soil728]|uniref:3-hydroxybutyrate dehydrogenase n=1 Tax=Janibacter sp. Soil728 TaxID=1736393 RepID=UPI0006FCCFF2|nr:3-hydroxybutyrate dehydrogenase [Janibacter sp. Soil728]KRE37252.1 3-hydroxybutyrate dehydrogenase [Janibacter sp. Soil728]
MTHSHITLAPDLTGRHVMVTGAASGIGAACVAAFASAGARVTAVDLDQGGLDRLADELSGLTVTPCPADLADLDGLADLPGEVDVLVNNAGIQHVSPVHEFPVEKFDLIQRLMLQSPFRLIRANLPHMYEQRWGRIVNISSVHGLRASAFKSAYVSAKHGLEGLSKVVALEGAEHGVTSNCLNPAYVRTPLVEKQIADQARTHDIPEEEVLEQIMLAPVALKRLVEVDEVAALALFLCSTAATSITGSSLPLDGGWTAH